MVSVKDVQQELAQLGLYTGVIDDKWGDVTEQALKAFQRNNGLPENGKISTKLLDLLFVKPIPDRVQQSPPKPIKSKWPHDDTASLISFYGEPGEDNVLMPLPYDFRLSYDLNTVVKRVMVHAKCRDAWEEIFTRTLDTYGLATLKDLRLHYFGGGMVHRTIRGGTRLSTHNWCAMDFDPANNGLKTSWKDAAFSRPEYKEFWQIVESVGGVSLGKQFDYDAMHIQFAWR